VPAAAAPALALFDLPPTVRVEEVFDVAPRGGCGRQAG
jgi:hypothetical protein